MRRLVGFGVFALLSLVPAFAAEGVRPVGADGKPLNLDFETGTLKCRSVNAGTYKIHAGGPMEVRFKELKRRSC